MPRETNRPFVVGLVQINNSFSGQNYLPYSIACLQAYVQEHAPDASRYEFLAPIYKRIPIADAVDHLIDADIVGFSTYVWNAEISLEVARRLKARRPDITIIFGGPQVPDDPEDFLKENRFIDLVVHNEGERTFLNLLEAFPENDWSDMTGVSYLEGDAIHRSLPTPRFRDLAEVPSPFLNGMLDKLMQDNPNESWIGLWESNRGCPFKCTFCDWGSATAAKVTKFDIERLYRELDWFADNKIAYIFVCDANFGIQKRDVELSTYVADLRRRTGYPHGFSVQNTKNATERAYETQKILADAGLNKGVALSMQSLDPDTLVNIKRDNISLDTYLELARRFTRDGVETYSDLIIGLPGETYDSFCEGVNQLILAGQHNRIQFNNLSILPNAEMGSADYRKTHGMITVRSEIINIHGSREILEDDVPEYQDLVVATASMPAADWRKTRAFSWMAAFLHFDKLCQIPLIVANRIGGLDYRQMIDAFLTVDAAAYPTIAWIRDLFEKEAASIQNGGPEYVFSSDWLGIFWPADEYAYISLTVDGRLDAFYDEAHRLLNAIADKAGAPLDKAILNDAIKLNRALISQPGQKDDTTCRVEYDLMSFWHGERTGQPVELARKTCDIQIERSKSYYSSLQDWCREIVWWGNKKGAYLYSNQVREIAPHPAGHY